MSRKINKAIEREIRRPMSWKDERGNVVSLEEIQNLIKSVKFLIKFQNYLMFVMLFLLCYLVYWAASNDVITKLIIGLGGV